TVSNLDVGRTDRTGWTGSIICSAVGVIVIAGNLRSKARAAEGRQGVPTPRRKSTRPLATSEPRSHEPVRKCTSQDRSHRAMGARCETSGRPSSHRSKEILRYI